MTYTLFDIVYRVARELGTAFEGTATSGSAGNLIDNINLKDRFSDNFFNSGLLMLLYDYGGAGAAPQGEWGKITDFAQSTGTIEHQSFTTPAASGDRYAAITPEYTLETLIQCINRALNNIEIPYVDTSITTEDSKTEYTLPDDILSHNINVWIQRYEDTGDYQWMRVHGWYIAETETGTAKTLMFIDQPFVDLKLKIEYWKPHPSLNVKTDELAEAINIERVAVEAAYHCLLWKRSQKSQADPYLNQRIEELGARVMQARYRHPAKRPRNKLATMGNVDNIDLNY